MISHMQSHQLERRADPNYFVPLSVHYSVIADGRRQLRLSNNLCLIYHMTSGATVSSSMRSINLQNMTWLWTWKQLQWYISSISVRKALLDDMKVNMSTHRKLTTFKHVVRKYWQRRQWSCLGNFCEMIQNIEKSAHVASRELCPYRPSTVAMWLCPRSLLGGDPNLAVLYPKSCTTCATRRRGRVWETVQCSTVWGRLNRQHHFRQLLQQVACQLYQ